MGRRKCHHFYADNKKIPQERKGRIDLSWSTVSSWTLKRRAQTAQQSLITQQIFGQKTTQCQSEIPRSSLFDVSARWEIIAATANRDRQMISRLKEVIYKRLYEHPSLVEFIVTSSHRQIRNKRWASTTKYCVNRRRIIWRRWESTWKETQNFSSLTTLF